MRPVSRSEREAQRVSEIVDRKKVVLSNLKLLRNRLFSIAYNGIIHKKGAMAVKSELLRTFNLNRWGRYKDKTLIECAFKYYLSNFNQNEQFLMKNLEKDSNLKNANAVIHQVARDFEHTKKQGMLEEQINVAREHKTPMFLCSYHNNPAKDHKDYQAKIYIDENWRNYGLNKKTTRAISKYIKSNNTMSIQKVTTSVPYLIYRPYCKHYFVNVSISDALSDSIPTLLKRYGAIRDEHNLDPRTYRQRKKEEEKHMLKGFPQTTQIVQKIRLLG